MARREAAPPAPPVVASGVQMDEGGRSGSRPGPKVATHVSVPDPAAQRPAAPAGKAPDASTAIGQPSVKDLNERRFQAKDTALREAARAAGNEINKQRDDAPAGFLAMRMTELAEGDETETPAAAAPETETPAAEETPKPKPKSSDAELAAIAEKERENRDLRRKLKTIENTPRLTWAQVKEKVGALAKTNPRGVAEYFGIPFEELSVSMLSGKAADAIKLEDEAPATGKREPTETEKELGIERAKRLELERAIGEERLQKAVATMVRDGKNKDGSLRWGNIVRIGDDPTDGRARAIKNAQLFGAGVIDEKGNRLEKPRRMKAFSDADGKSVVEHFLDAEDRRLGAVGKKLGAGGQRPSPRVTAPGARPGPRAIPSDPSDPNHPRNRPSYIELGEAHRARHFGPRR